ncbi:tetratricopeptide repeat protein [Polymorphospora sp. NPDC051019]|uniref:ATP-binding protein n=1 Tax=Polymorphospora sp. NPDC051019 TaxID=3155725 RepID=UPI003449C0D1
MVQAGALHGGVHVHQSMPAPPPKAERTLPADVPGFVGRHDELARLLAAVTDAADGQVQAVAVHAVDGMAGIGKTALVVHAAHHLAARFPDGQRFIALRAHAPGQPRVDPAAALETLLQADGVAAEQIPAGLDARAGLWRHRMTDKKILLVLDDAADTNHVTPLLPAAPGCLVLITSRRKLTTLPGVTLLALDILPPDQAVELFIERAGHRALHEPEAVYRITALCGYLPLAITLTAARLHTHRTWTVTDIADDLTEARDRLAELASGDLAITAAFDLSYHDLSSDRQRLFRRLGLHPGPDLDRYATAALDNTTLTQARRSMEDLLEHNLITEPHRGRYRFHDLIAVHARILATTDPKTNQDAARDRLLDYYLHTATAAARHLPHHTSPTSPTTWPAPTHAPTITNPEQATDWLTREQPNLVAATVWAAAHHHPAAIGIPKALQSHLRAHGPWDLAQDLHHTALATARHIENQPAQAHTLTNLAIVQRLTGDYAAAATNSQQALDISQQFGDPHGQADALNALAGVQQATGDYAGAAINSQQALDICQRLGQRHGQADALETLAHVLRATGDYAAAATNAQQALDLHQQLGNPHGQADALNALARVQHATGDYAAAATNAQQALDLHQQLGNPHGQAITLNTLARIQHATGNYAAAATTAQQALDISQQLGRRHGQANVLNTLGLVQQAIGDPTTAVATLQQALDLFHDVGDPDGQAETLNHIGQIQLTTTTLGIAHEQFTAALDIARRVHAPAHEARALEGIGTYALRHGRRDEGLAHLRNALTICRRINSPNTVRIEAALSHQDD